jgi:hypothetical protein
VYSSFSTTRLRRACIALASLYSLLLSSSTPSITTLRIALGIVSATVLVLLSAYTIASVGSCCIAFSFPFATIVPARPDVYEGKKD